MADDIRSDIIINVDTSVGIAEIKNLQRQISQLNAQLLKSGAQQAASAQNIQRNLINNINATGQFAASVKNISTTAESFTTALERNKLSMGEYFRYAGASTKTFGRLFRSEFDTIEKVARERVKTLQTQYVKLGRDGSGAMKAIAVRPLALDMENLATKTAIAAQKQQLFNQLVKQGSTNLLNFGKNTQWAGRQLMVGFTIPLAIFGSMAVKEFEKVEKQAIRFKRVYGEAFDTEEATDKALEDMKRLADGFTKYGIEVNKTLELAADAAQMGLTGAALRAQVTEATRLAVLGEVDQQEALRATISVTNAFGVAAEQLAGKIDFLNSVENETVTAINDLTIAIPKAGPVVKQLGGDVEDLAFFLTAMKEGGINASEGANALKSGLAALINPTGKAAEMLNGFGINVKGIVQANKGDVKGIVIGFAQALDTLDPLNRARAIEQLFGKFQFSRLSTLFQNVIKDGSQAQKVLKLANATSEELAIISERELKRVEESPLFKFQNQLEKFQAALAPVGAEFLKAITPLVQFGAEVLKNFNNLSDGAKQFAVVATTLIGGIGPVFLMMFGLIANGAANLIKLFANVMGVFSKTGQSSRSLGISTDYMTQQQLEANAVASSLNQSHSRLIQTFAVEAGAVDRLASSYARAVVQQSRLLGRNPETGAPVMPRGKTPKKYASGVLSVPGPKGAGDVVPAMLSPGEAVIPAKQAKKYRGLVSSMISDNIPGFRFGFNPFASMLSRSNVATRMRSEDFVRALRANGKGGKYQSAFDTQSGADYLTKYGILNPRQKQARSDMERDLFGLDPKSTSSSKRPTYGYAKTSILQSLINRVFGIKGKNFNSLTTNPSEKSLSRYGNIDLITKSAVARRSSAYPNDTLMEYVRAKNSGLSLGRIQSSMRPAPMRGASSKQLGSFERLGMPFGSNLVPGTKNQYSINPRSPYIETHTPGGFGFKEIDKIIARDPAIAKQLKAELRAAGLAGVRVSGSGFVARLFRGMGVPGYENGTSSAPKSFEFDRSFSIDSAHMSASPEGRLSRKQVTEIFDREIEQGVRSGALARMGLDPNQMRADFKAELSKLGGTEFKLFSNMVEPLQADANRATSNIRSEAMTGKGYLAALRRMPRGLFGSGILSRLPEGHGISDRQIKSYALNLDKAMRSELKSSFNRTVTEADLQDMYERAETKAVRKIKSPAAKTMIQDLNLLGRLRTSVAKPGQGASSRGKEYSPIFGNVRDRLIGARRGGNSQRIFGASFVDKFERNFLSQGSVKLPEELRSRVRERYNSLSKKEKFAFSNRLINSIYQVGRPDVLKAQKERFESVEKLLKEKSYGQLSSKAEKEVAKPRRSQKSNTSEKPIAPTQKTISQLSKILSAGNSIAGSQKMPAVAPAKTFSEMVMGMLARRFGRNKFATGVVSVPGPKGKGDVVPAMLSPGEAVIPTKMAKKYSPLISSMISDNIPGYFDGYDPLNDPFRTPSTNTFAPPKFDGDPFGSSAQADSEENKQAKKSGRIFRKEAFAPRVLAASGKQMGSAVATGLGSGLRAVGNAIAKPIGSAIGTMAGNQVVDENGKVINQAALDRKEAKRLEAAGLTRGPRGGYKDANGNRISRQQAQSRLAASRSGMDPKQRFAQGAQRIGMIGMGASMATGAAMMLPGEAGKVAQDIAPVLLGLSTLAMFIQGPVSAALMALVAAVALPMYAAYKLDEAFKAAQKSALDLSGSLGAGDAALQKFAKFAGNATASEIMDKRRAGSLSQFQTATGKTTFGEAFVQTEEGKTAIGDVTKSLSTNGRVATQSQLVNQMATAVASGAMSAAEARSVVANISKEMGDYALGIQVNAQLINILGPNGENLAKDPLKVRLEILEDQQEQVKTTMDLAKKSIEGTDWNAIGTMVGGAAAGAGIGAGIGAAIGTAILPGIGTGIGAVAGTIIGGVSGGITGYVAGSTGRKEDLGLASGAAVAMQQMALEQQQQMSDSLELEYEQRIANAESAGDLVKKAKLLKELEDARVDILTQNQKLTTGIMESYKTASPELQDALMTGAKTSVTAAYKDTPMAAVAALGLKNLESSNLTPEKKYLVTMQLASKEVDPVQLVNILSMPESTQTRTVNIITKYGGAFANQVSAMTQFFTDPVTGKPIDSVVSSFVAQVDGAKTSKEAADIIDFYTKVTQASGKDAAFAVDFFIKNPTAAKKLQGMYDEIDKIKGPITVKVVADIVGAENLNLVGQDIAEFEKLTEEGKEIFLRTYATIISSVKTVHDPKVQAWLKSEGAAWANSPDPIILKEYAEAMSFQKAETGNADMTLGDFDPNAKTPPTGGAKQDPYEEPLQRLREIREAAVKATGGITELNKWLGGNKNMKQFKGIEQQLIGRGVNRTFIDYLLGLDKDIQDKFIRVKNGIVTLKEAGKNMAKVFNEIALGEFQVGLKEASRDALNQSTAFNKLVAAGMSVAEALKAIEDPAVAAAIASKDISSKELKQLGKDANDSAAKVGLVASRLQLIEDIQQASGESAMKNAFSTNNTKFTELQQAAIEFDSTLSETYQKFLSGMITELPAEFATRMQQVINDIDFKQSVFDDGFNKAMEAFSAQEEKLQIDMEIKLKDFSIAGVAQKGAREILAQAQREIAALQFQMDNLQAGIQEIEWQEDSVNEKYDKRLDALDKIEKANDAISAQQKTQISLADALSQGDIAAAARAAQEMRAQSAQGAIGTQRDMLEASRQGALSNLRSSGGKSRTELEAEILRVEKEIFKIEETRLEPAAEAVRIAEANLAVATEALTVLNKTKLEWTQIKNGIDLAVTSSQPFKDAMQAALDIVKDIVSHWNSLGSKTLSAALPPAPATSTRESVTYDPTRGYFVPVADARVNTGIVFRDPLTGDKFTSPTGNTPYNAKGAKLMMSQGGPVPYMGDGGIFEPKGTDTVPAMLTPGEFVVRKYAVEKYGVDKMKAINNGTHSSDSVYNYEVNVNVKTDANADQIARSVIGQIKQIDSQRIRGNKF